MATRTPPNAPQITAGEVDPQSTSSKEAQADQIITKNLLWGAGAGILPIPLFDVVAIAAVQIKMLKELSDLYEVPFRESAVKNIIAALLAGLGAPTLSAMVTISAFKFVPLLGPTLALLSSPGFAVAFTYAVGKVFTQHFASGGTFLDFDPKKVKAYFARQFEEGKLVAAKTKSETTPPKTD
jgi:uncharacterized protein (DUF697 family)